jgi:hypothetical protein
MARDGEVAVFEELPYPGVYRAFGISIDELHVTDTLGAVVDATVEAAAPSGGPFWATADGGPHPDPPTSPPTDCLVYEHEVLFGERTAQYVYFLVPYRNGWFVDWYAIVADGMVDSSETYDGGDPVDVDVPLEELRLPPSDAP